MKKVITLTSFLLFHASITFSQVNFTDEYGKVTQYEMSMQQYEEDKDAEALVIYDWGENRFTPEEGRGFIMYKERKTKIKILSQAGEKYATIAIPIYSNSSNDFDHIENIEATTYNFEDGILRKTQFDTKNIYEEKINKNWSVKKLTLPDIKVGSVIEIKYTISSPFYFNMDNWNFQKKIPVLKSELRYKAIPYYEYSFNVSGVDKLDKFTSVVDSQEKRFGRLLYKELVYTFGLNNIPAFRDEEFISSEKDYMITINFQMSKVIYPTGGFKEIISTWPQLCDDLLKSSEFGKYINACQKEAKRILPTLNLESEDELEKVKIITEYVKHNYKWNISHSISNSTKLLDFLNQKTGNNADINLFLIGLLRGANIKVNPVILSTRENGAINRDYPFMHLFNYVIAEVEIDNKKYHLDATESLLSYNIVPLRCVNVIGLVVKPKTEEWTIVNQVGTSHLQKDLSIEVLPEEGKIKVKARYGAKGNTAYYLRSGYIGYGDNTGNRELNLSEYLKDDESIETIGDITVSNFGELNKPFIFSFNFEASIEKSSGKIFINPFCYLSIKENPFKQTSRTLPIDLININRTNYNAQIEIPEGYKVEHLPETLSVDDKNILIHYLITLDGKQIKVNASYSYKKNIYDAQEYMSLKQSLSQAVEKFNEMIVLVKE